MSFVNRLFDIALPVSEAVKPRTAQKVYFHLLSEIGELAEEVNIASGELYKDPGPDGVMGEAADIMNCIADLLWITTPDKQLLSEACNDIAELVAMHHFDSDEGWPSFSWAKENFAEATTNVDVFLGLVRDTYDLRNNEIHQIIADTMRAILILVKSDNPDITADEFLTAYLEKCAKWQRKAA
jgi:hypothetical protein